jgi:hypothetical protein
MRSVRCANCGEKMEIIKVDKYSKPHGVALVSAGLLFLVAMPIEALLGLVLVPFGLVVSFTKKDVWNCPSCAAIVDRSS